MASFQRFEEIKAWQKARILCNEIRTVCNETPLAKDYKLRDQVESSSGSIMDNIAEGHGRGGNKEFIHFLEISHGSACECQSQLYRILDRGYITTETFQRLYEAVAEIKRMLLSLIRYLFRTDITGPKYKLRDQPE